MQVIIRGSEDEVARAAADVFSSYVRPGAVLGVATGSTPVGTYRELIRRHRAGDLSFAGTQMFALDEYAGLSRDHPQSYAQTIRREFASDVDIADSDVHVPDGAAADLVQASREYEEDIDKAGGIDIQLLGVGTNGHIGFNEPRSSLNSRTRPMPLHPQTIADNARFFDSADEVPRRCITQGLGTIQRAGHLLLLATGEKKADAVARLVEGPVSASCPASVLQLHPTATVIVDDAAAAQLVHRDYYAVAADGDVPA